MQEPSIFLLCGSFIIPALIAVPLAKIRMDKTKQEFTEAWSWWFGVLFLGWLTVYFGNLYSRTGNDGFSITFWLCFVGTIAFLATGKQNPEPQPKRNWIPSNDSSNKRKTLVYSPGDLVTCKVAGVSFENRQEVIQKLKSGDSISLVREFDNVHDPNAIQVIIYSWDRIGYIPTKLAKILNERVFDKYNMQKIKGVVTHIYNDNPNIPTGIEISFYIPHEGTLEAHLSYHPYIENQTTGLYKINELNKLEKEFLEFSPNLNKNTSDKENIIQFAEDFHNGISTIKKFPMSKKEVDEFVTTYRQQLSGFKNTIERNKQLVSLKKEVRKKIEINAAYKKAINNEDNFDEDDYWDNLAEKFGYS